LFESRCLRPLDLPLAEDLTEAASDLSPRFSSVVDPLGLSVDFCPGIFDLIAVRKERDDSFVSDLLNDGYESREGPSPVGVSRPPRFASLSFDGWLPMVVVCYNGWTELALLF